MENPSAPLRDGQTTILILDDERMVLEVSRLALTRAGYTVLTTADPDEAIAVADSYRGEIALFITNCRLPDGRSGREIAEQLLQSNPGLPVLHISGYPEVQLRQEHTMTRGGFYLAKPFTPFQLVSKVREILARSR
ncbi:MAG TPA: response regulator [Bryobacteraceae bacterium]|jgi:DNA-binding response OmpR family regulator|nr:response regulator [Bryobacteraceae bacterium]